MELFLQEVTSFAQQESFEKSCQFLGFEKVVTSGCLSFCQNFLESLVFRLGVEKEEFIDYFKSPECSSSIVHGLLEVSRVQLQHCQLTTARSSSLMKFSALSLKLQVCQFQFVEFARSCRCKF